MGKDKFTFKKIREERAKEALLVYHLDGIAEIMLQTETERNIFSVILSSQLNGMAETAGIISKVVQK